MKIVPKLAEDNNIIDEATGLSVAPYTNGILGRMAEIDNCTPKELFSKWSSRIASNQYCIHVCSNSSDAQIMNISTKCRCAGEYYDSFEEYENRDKPTSFNNNTDTTINTNLPKEDIKNSFNDNDGCVINVKF